MLVNAFRICILFEKKVTRVYKIAQSQIQSLQEALGKLVILKNPSDWLQELLLLGRQLKIKITL